jgi:hypothetical protein
VTSWLVAARLFPPEDEAPAAMMRTPWQHRLRELKIATDGIAQRGTGKM